jgi:hypothetical protein
MATETTDPVAEEPVAEDDTIEFAGPNPPEPETISRRRGRMRAFIAAGAVASALACTARHRRRRAAERGREGRHLRPVPAP